MSRAILPLVLGALLGAAAVHVWSRPGAGIEPEFSGSNLTDAVIGGPRSAAPIGDDGGGEHSGTDGTIDSSFSARIEDDPESVLAELAEISPPVRRREAALAVLASLGIDHASISRTAAMLPEMDRMNFSLDAIASIAVDDPAGAIDLVLELDDLPARLEAIRRVAAALGRTDPQMALAFGDSIGNYELGDEFRNAILKEWASNDPRGFLAFVESAAPSDIRRATEAFAIAAAVHPDELLAVLDRIPQSARSIAERAALDMLVATDIGAALAHLASLPVGNTRDSLYLTTAQSFAEHDLDGALSWANSLQPPSKSAMTGVLRVMAKTDPVRGVNISTLRIRRFVLLPKSGWLRGCRDWGCAWKASCRCADGKIVRKKSVAALRDWGRRRRAGRLSSGAGRSAIR